MCAYQHRDVAALQAPIAKAQARRRIEERLDFGRHRLRCHPSGAPLRDRLLTFLPLDKPHYHRRLAVVAEARFGSFSGRACDRMEDDLGIEKRRWVARKEGVDGLHEPCIGTPVGPERTQRASPGARLEIGEHVGAAETIDGLLRIADVIDRQIRSPIDLVEDLKLQGIGVLKLIDQRRAVAAPDGVRQGGSVRARERLCEPGEQIIVGVNPKPAFTRLELALDIA